MWRRENSAAINFGRWCAIWLLLGVLMGLTLALEFIFPDLGRGVPALVFGRLRQAHVNTVLFAWLSAGMMAHWLYIVPQLTGRKLWSERLGNFTVLLWNVAVLVGIVGLLTANSQSREYAEMVWIVDIGVMLVLLLNMINILMTIRHRTEPKLYVSLWYIIGTVIWFPMVYFIGNVMWNPPTGALTGINDAIFNWFYGHNVLGLWFTTGMLAIIYYIVPLETRTPLYSHALSLVAFWGLAFFYTGVGAHHLLWAPIPYWLKTIAVADSVGMVIPVAAFLINIFLTMRGNWSHVVRSIPLRFIITGWAAYILVSFQGSHQALRSINLLTHFTQYVPTHAHLALLFFGASTLVGGFYFIIPRIAHIRIYSRTLANVGYWLHFVGFAIFFAGFTLTGLVQGTNWVHQGLPIWSVLPGLRPYQVLKAAGGVLIVLGFFAFVLNLQLSIRAKLPILEPERAEQAERTEPGVPAMPAPAAGS
jgi:cbb3-type cytochrome c oxidase subunit I